MVKELKKVVALCGGVGGAKLLDGLYRFEPSLDLVAVVNTGDDFEHLGFNISPDIDTVAYTLAKLADPVRGWGREGETWSFMSALRELGEPDWFQLGDKDLALHVARSKRLGGGEALSEVTSALCETMGLTATILPMADTPVRTVLATDVGRLAFQEYFVRDKCVPAVLSIEYVGASTAVAPADVLAALRHEEVHAVVICPSNPYLSIDPILSVPGIRDALRVTRAPVIAVSPLIGGNAVKGPTAKIMRELGLPTSARTVAEHYGDFLDGLVVDSVDIEEIDSLPIPSIAVPTLMQSEADRVRLAGDVIAFAKQIGSW